MVPSNQKIQWEECNLKDKDMLSPADYKRIMGLKVVIIKGKRKPAGTVSVQGGFISVRLSS
jgi:hypothetical protein